MYGDSIKAGKRSMKMERGGIEVYVQNGRFVLLFYTHAKRVINEIPIMHYDWCKNCRTNEQKKHLLLKAWEGAKQTASDKTLTPPSSELIEELFALVQEVVTC